jgi:hypothetical protein
MKSKAIRFLLGGGALALAVSLSINANAQLIAYGVSDAQNSLITFNPASPSTILTAHAISGLQANEQIRGIDFVGNTLYGLGSQSHLYTLNPATGAATQVGSGQFSPILNGLDFGFNASGSTFYVASDLSQNLSISTAGVATAGPNYVSGANSIDGMAFDHSSGIFYGISTGSSHNWLQLNPTTGAVTVIGNTGVNYNDRLALDVSPFNNVAYLSATVNSQANLYTVNKATGALTLVGTVGPAGQFTSGLDALVVVPEPSSVALFAVGGLLLGLLIRRK